MDGRLIEIALAYIVHDKQKVATSFRPDECEYAERPCRTLRTSKDRAHYLCLADTAIAAGQTFFPPKS